MPTYLCTTIENAVQNNLSLKKKKTLSSNSINCHEHYVAFKRLILMSLVLLKS